MSPQLSNAIYRFATKGLNPLVDPFPMAKIQRLIRKARAAEAKTKS